MRLTQVRASFGLLPKETAVGQKWCFYSGVSRVDSGCVAGGQWVCRGWAVGENKRITGSRDKPHLRLCHSRGLLPKVWFLGFPKRVGRVVGGRPSSRVEDAGPEFRRIEFFGKKLRGGRVKMLNPFHFPQFFQDDDEHTVHTSFRTTAKLTPVSVASFLRMRGLRRWAPLRVPAVASEIDACVAPPSCS